jgi:hypothetical protein
LARRLVDPSHGQFQFPTIFVALDEDVDLGADGRELRDVARVVETRAVGVDPRHVHETVHVMWWW